MVSRNEKYTDAKFDINSDINSPMAKGEGAINL